MAEHRTSGPLMRAGVMLGIGMGGFVDGILLHQIMQAHAMLSAQLPLDTMENMRTNMTADGLFHAGVWLATLIGIAMLFNAGKRPNVLWSGRVLAGAMLLGWGVFNVVEGVIDHHVLHLHHLIERLGLSVWDWAFLAFGVALILAGALIARTPAGRG